MEFLASTSTAPPRWRCTASDAAVLAGAGRRGHGLVLFYLLQPAIPAAIARVLPVLTVLENKYYMDWFNENVLARAARGWAPACGRAATRASSTAC
jgi:hypothetical protein